MLGTYESVTSTSIINIPHIRTSSSANTSPYLQIHKAKAEKARERILKEEMDAKRAKTKAARERRQERVASKRNALTGEEEPETKET